MSPLRLPENAAQTLDRAYTGEANTSENDKWLIYVTAGIPLPDAEDFYKLAMTAYNDQLLNSPESEWEELGFLKPPTQQTHPNLRSPSLQQILEHQLRMVSRRLPNLVPDLRDEQGIYVFGFIALTRPDWRETGVTAVHCDKQRGKWKVTRCDSLPVDQVGMQLTSVSDLDNYFDEIRGEYDDSDNTHEDNQGGPIPVGKWQLWLYGTRFSESRNEKIADPRGGPDFD